MNSSSQDNRIAVVTGAGGGIGLEVARTLLERGDRVIAVDTSRTSLESLTTQPFANQRLATIEADVSQESEWERILNCAEDMGGRPDILVNNAGISPKRAGEKIPGDEIPLDEWNRVLAVNLTGPFLGIRALAPGMKQNGFGRIINMSSLAARDGGRLGGIHYAATKTGLLGVTRSFARELAPFGITVNAIAPGRIDAGMVSSVPDEVNNQYLKRIPVGRLGQASDVARAVDFLASNGSGFITGVTVDVNGGSYMG
jgi:3-oxoacyl-[acyl-carrier protein] reductase